VLHAARLKCRTQKIAKKSISGHPCKFQQVLRLGSVTAFHSSSGHQPNFAALNRGHHLYSAGRPSRWVFADIYYLLLNCTQGTRNIQTEIKIKPNTTSVNQPVHIPIIKHTMSSILNRSEQRSVLSLNSNKSLNAEMLADISADTLDK